MYDIHHDAVVFNPKQETRVAGLLRRVRVRTGSETGQAIVEMALAVPILLLLVTGIATFGITFANYLSLADAVGIGGRQLAISRANTTNPCSLVASTVQAALPNGMVAGNLTFTYVLNGSTFGPYTGVAASTCSSSSNTTGAAGDLVEGKNAQVIVTYPCSLSVYGHNIAPTCNLTSQVTELVQ